MCSNISLRLNAQLVIYATKTSRVGKSREPDSRLRKVGYPTLGSRVPKKGKRYGQD